MKTGSLKADDEAWFFQRVGKWKITDVSRLLSLFGWHLTVVRRKK